MLGLGIWEILIILITALVVLGPDKLPQTARQLARLLGEFRRVSDDVRRNFDDVMAEPVDPQRPDAPRPLPLGALAAHVGAAPGAHDGPAPPEASALASRKPCDGTQAAHTAAAVATATEAAGDTAPADAPSPGLERC